MIMKAVIFDMDGVLVDSEMYYIDLFRDLVRRHGGEPDEEILFQIPGASSRKTWELMVSLWPEPITRESLRTLFHNTYPVVRAPYGKILFPGVRETLHALKDSGLRLALASSTAMDHIQIMLDETGLRDCFEVVVSGHQFKESKPDPQIYLYTIDQLGLTADDCIAVEDSTYGIQAGKNAGLRVIARRDDRFRFDQSLADYSIDDIRELPELIAGLDHRA